MFNSEFVHELPDEEDSASGGVQKIFFGHWIGESVGIKPLPLVSNMDFKPILKDLKLDVDFLVGILLVAVVDGVGNGFMDSQFNLVTSLFVKAYSGGYTSSRFLGDFNIIKLALEDNLDDAIVRLHSRYRNTLATTLQYGCGKVNDEGNFLLPGLSLQVNDPDQTQIISRRVSPWGYNPRRTRNRTAVKENIRR